MIRAAYRAPRLHSSMQFTIIPLLLRGGAVWQLVGLITRRSQVQILPPLPAPAGERGSLEPFLLNGVGLRDRAWFAVTPKSSGIGQGAHWAPCCFPEHVFHISAFDIRKHLSA